MINFIKIHENGTEKMINLDWVEEVCSKDDKAIIYFAFSKS